MISVIKSVALFVICSSIVGKTSNKYLSYKFLLRSISAFYFSSMTPFKFFFVLNLLIGLELQGSPENYFYISNSWGKLKNINL